MGAHRKLITGSIVTVIILAALGLVTAGVLQLHRIDSGTKVVATVAECHLVPVRHTIDCTGTWLEGGSLAGHGHVVTGYINGAGYSYVGKKVSARLHGGRAYAQTLNAPIASFSIGGVLLIVAGWIIWMVRTGRELNPAKWGAQPFRPKSGEGSA